MAEYEDKNENRKLGAIVYAAMFTVYIAALVTLAILGVPLMYFFTIVLAGFPVSGITLSLLQGNKWLKQQDTVKKDTVYTVDNSEFVDNNGNPVIRL